jgi:hypothetical protein
MSTSIAAPLHKQSTVIDAADRFAARNLGEGSKVQHMCYGHGKVAGSDGHQRIVDFELTVTKYPCELTRDEQAEIGQGADLEFIRFMQVQRLTVPVQELRDWRA